MSYRYFLVIFVTSYKHECHFEKKELVTVAVTQKSNDYQ